MSVDPQKRKPTDMPAAPQPEALAEDEERDDTIIAVALRYSLLAVVLIGAAGGGLYWWLMRPEVVAQVAVQPPTPPQVRELPQIDLPQIPFTDVTDASGIDFIHENGAYGDKLLPETMGGGCAFLDYNSDGQIDILFVNSERWPWDSRPAAQVPATLALYQNDGGGKFINATDAAGLAVTLYGQGCAVGDIDNDGDPDLFISAITPRESLEDGKADQPGPHHLFRNDEGRFVDITAEAGVAGRYGDWGSSTGWFDYDNDGDLDLWVCNYVVWSREYDAQQNFSLVGVGRGYGRPQNFEGTYSHLFRNDGEGKFTEVSEEAGIQVKNPLKGTPMGKSLGLGFADFDGDGWLDVVVANDTVQKFLFHNNRNGTFDEVGAVAGIAFDSSGSATGAMGVDIGCPRDNADCFAVTIGNFSNEMTSFYVSLPGSLLFSDEAVSNGLGPNTRLQLTFGVFFFDADLDGRMDVFGANGHLEEDIAKVQASQSYEQPPQLFWNAGAQYATEFVPLSAKECGADFIRPMVGRGAAYADLDGDGDLDLLIGASGRRPRLLRNDQQLGHHWLRLKLQGNGTTSNRDAIGARVDLTVAGEVRRQFVTRTRSYISQSEPIVTFGLGDKDAIDKVEIRWPDGKEQTLEGLAVDTLHVVKQGE